MHRHFLSFYNILYTGDTRLEVIHVYVLVLSGNSIFPWLNDVMYIILLQAALIFKCKKKKKGIYTRLILREMCS